MILEISATFMRLIALMEKLSVIESPMGSILSETTRRKLFRKLR